MPTTRPRALRLRTTSSTWFRIDAGNPADWDWHAFPRPASRFDSAAGRHRVRYAADAGRTAMRERFDRDRRQLAASHLDLHLVRISGAIRVLDLRRDETLDALGLDDQISTSRAPGVWAAAQRLTDLVDDWFGARCHGLVYRSRTTPQRSANLAFFAHAPVQAHDLGPLRAQAALLDSCILSDGFALQGWR